MCLLEKFASPEIKISEGISNGGDVKFYNVMFVWEIKLEAVYVFITISEEIDAQA